MIRTASAMFALATAMIASAASCSSRSERLGDARADRLLGGLAVERHAAADQPLAEPPEDEVGVGVGRLLAALAVGRRARGREPADCGPLRSEPAASIVASEPPPAPIVSTSIEGKTDRVPVLDEPLVGRAQRAVVDERDVGARAAHVDADHVGVAAQRRGVAGGHGAGGDARRGEPHRELLHGLGRHHAAAGVQDQQVAVVAVVLEAPLELG